MYDDTSLLGGASLFIDPAGYDVSLLSDDVSLTRGNAYPLGGDSLGASTATGHTSASEVKDTASLIT